MKKNDLKNRKINWVTIVSIAIPLLVYTVLAVILYTYPGVGSEGKGFFGETSAAFEFWSGAFITFAGFFLAMQFDERVDKKNEANHQLEIWELLQDSLEMMKEDISKRNIVWLRNQCDSMLRFCEMDASAMITMRRSPLFKWLYTFLIELDSVKNDGEIEYKTLNELGKRFVDRGGKCLMTSNIFLWVYKLYLLTSIDYTYYLQYEKEEVYDYIEGELKKYLFEKDKLKTIKDDIELRIKTDVRKQMGLDSDNFNPNVADIIKGVVDDDFCSKVKTNENYTAREYKKNVINQQVFGKQTKEEVKIKKQEADGKKE